MSDRALRGDQERLYWLICRKKSQEKVLKGPLEKYTAHTITNARALRKELEVIRRNGYSFNRGEWRESVCGVAAPIAILPAT